MLLPELLCGCISMLSVSVTDALRCRKYTGDVFACLSLDSGPDTHACVLFSDMKRCFRDFLQIWKSVYADVISLLCQHHAIVERFRGLMVLQMSDILPHGDQTYIRFGHRNENVTKPVHIVPGGDPDTRSVPVVDCRIKHVSHVHGAKWWHSFCDDIRSRISECDNTEALCSVIDD